MRIEELMSRTRDALAARRVFAEPHEVDGVTVIAAAAVSGGGGGGIGRHDGGLRGEGAGFGVIARPVGAYVVKDGRVRWHPAVDVNRLVATAGAVVVAGLLAAARLARARG